MKIKWWYHYLWKKIEDYKIYSTIYLKIEDTLAPKKYNISSYLYILIEHTLTPKKYNISSYLYILKVLDVNTILDKQYVI